ncbi:uncharacterized protein LOC117644487 [Thrips palmi]|uniref:Uncharacterized protein LOC117644487 n=1 Tax=Thrips palmi TaxID=161013 RepID=A0A6P8ZM31_THRPL|nr:uncharacterized protein LOC117644487 [Thrips palmi]
MALLTLCVLALGLASALADVIVKEVAAGAMAILECHSNDDHHRFAYWQLHDDKVVGPGNAYDDYKYKYEVLTGRLYIKGVSTSEAGFYKCVSRALAAADPANIKIDNVELIVKKDWEEVYEDDPENNTFRAVTALTVVLVLLLVLLFFLRMRRSRPLRFRDLIDEESQDEAPAAAAAQGQARADVYRPTTLPSSSQGLGVKDNLAVAVDTDFPTVFESSHDGRL